MKFYLVGGAVRDMLLGRCPTEWDFSFSGPASDFLRAFPDAVQVGKSVRICLWRGRECTPLHDCGPEADLAERDLTINALALDEKGVLLMHPHALEDLQTRTLRPASPHAFSADPARIFRLARFAALWPDWHIHPDAFWQMRAIDAPTLASIPAERVGRELCKAFAAPAPARFFRILAQGNALMPWFQEMEKARHIPAGPARWHDSSVLEHSLKLMDALTGDPLAVWMALCHDLGKITTPPELLPHHHRHTQTGSPLVSGMVRRLRLSAVHEKAGVLAATEHMKAGNLRQLRIGTRRDLLWRVHLSRLWEPFWKLVDADCGSEVSPQARRERDILLGVRLPPDWQGKGEISAQKLRELHCLALAAPDAARQCT